MLCGILKLTLTLALFSTASCLPYMLSQTFNPHAVATFQISMTQDNSIIVTAGTLEKKVVVSKKASNGTYSMVQTITSSRYIMIASISLDGQTLAVGDFSNVKIYTYNSGTGQFDLTQTLPGGTSSITSGSMTNDAQWVVQKSDTSQVQVFKYDGSSFVLNQTITVNFTISRVRLSDNHLFLYIVENGASFDIYKFGGSSFAYAQSITGLGSGNKEISSTADGSVVILGNPSTNSA